MTAPFLNLHALHALPASLVNRDNNGAAKTITFGGVRRNRVSSQSWKRAIVEHMRHDRIDNAAYSLRTTRFPALTADILAADYSRDLDAALAKTAAVYSSCGFKAKENGGTAVSIYASQNLPAQVAAAINAHWDAIGDSSDVKDITSEAAAKTLVPNEVRAAVENALDVDKAIDLALTGRMLAEIPTKQVEGALAFAHAFSVHAASIENDFFTAVDDAAPKGEPVSSNLGEVDLTAPLLYRSAAVDRRLLAANLAAATDPAALADDALAAFLSAFVTAVPAAKHTSTHAATLPSLVVASQSRQPQSAASAFHSAVTGDTQLSDSTDRLLTMLLRQQAAVTPDDSLVALVLDPAIDEQVAHSGITTVASVADLIAATR
ncbi:type I-E CRISPR-associated protein Cas7/Cse4/CasC [Gordonia sihwensis]|uniref:type I-E CRISPR-associated protein Cas7/Cse4/CasC n=1 Tax=Gordonia sihwensis TaxID=173559 RepID=UPI0005EFF406|nr:type I-E CRISPR-associated protein Cas7/Cse4/CasC [Gordonia sihwensis]KJR10509.1 hypothetical protein UG54_00490 [Gordonia sihwensis]